MVEAAAPASDKQKALETCMAQIERTYGMGSIMRLGENTGIVVEAIPTGSLSLDLALGIGGVPKGRIVEIYGPESSGKTTLAPVSYTHLPAKDTQVLYTKKIRMARAKLKQYG